MTVLCQPEAVLDQVLEPLPGADLDHHVRLIVPLVPPVVCYPCPHADAAPRFGDGPAPFQQEADLTTLHREALLHGRVEVLGGEAPPGLDVQVGDEAFPAGVLGTNPHHNPLPAGRILYGVARLSDLPSLPLGYRGPRYLWAIIAAASTERFPWTVFPRPSSVTELRRKPFRDHE